MEDDLNFKAVLLSWFHNKNSKTNGFDTIEIDLVFYFFVSLKPPWFVEIGYNDRRNLNLAFF